MAFRPLTEAECGQTNPLVRLTSHLTHDHAFTETHGQAFPSSSDQLVEQFLQETRAAPQTFRMDDLMREMHEIESQRAALPPVPASAVKDQLNDDIWAQQYIQDGRNFVVNDNHEQIWAEIHAQEQVEHDTQNLWSNEFAQQKKEAEDLRDNTDEIHDIMDDPKFQYSKFLKFMKQVEDGEVSIQENNDANVWSEEFLNTASKENSDALAESWVDEHFRNNTGTDDSYNSQFWNKLQAEWKKLSENEETEHPWLSEYSEYYDSFKDYTFSESNPMFDVQDPLSRGKELLAEGDLPSAVLCFEAAVKKEGDNVEAWLLLGTTQAENEQDPNAICALKKCLELDPSNLTSLMALAVSYTNESYYNQACQSLVSWLRYNPKYGDLVPAELSFSGQVTTLLDPSQHKIVQDLFIKAAQKQPSDVDYEVQSGLGVLFNLSGEYDKAVDCFKAALNVKPDDSRLWNRLGATLANGSKPEEAVEAYHRALNLSPGFIRARYNVGITCINLSAYREAAEHFLTALNQQARGKDITNSVGTTSQISETIWSTLRMCVSLMNLDLKKAVDNRDLATLNEAFQISDN